jgi:hypothetical protein
VVRTIAMHTTPIERMFRLYLLCMVPLLTSTTLEYRWNEYTSWFAKLVLRATRMHPSHLHTRTWSDLPGKSDGKRHKVWYTSHTSHSEIPKHMELLLLAM